MTMYTKIIFVLLIVGYVLSTSVELDQTEDNTVDTNYWTDVRNDFILDAATISMGTLMVYPEYLSSASIECKHQINLYNGAYDVYQNDILRSIDYSSDGTNDFSGYQNCTEMGFRYLIVHYDDKMRSTHYGICTHYRCTPTDYDSFLDNYLYALRRKTVSPNIHTDEMLRLLEHPIRVYDSDIENHVAKEKKGKHIITIVEFLSAFALVIIGTSLHLILRSLGRIDNIQQPIVEPERYEEQPLSFLNLILGFSIFRSLERLGNTASKYKATGITALRGLKFLICIYLGFTFFYYLSLSPVLNTYKFNDDLSKNYAYFYYKSSLSIIDMLLWISGIYTAYSVYCALQKLGENFDPKLLIVTFLMELSYKVLRLFPLVFVAVLYYGWVAPIYGEGPIFSEQSHFNTSEIREYWYTYFLFMNNIHPKIVHQGLIWGGFFAVELQLFILFFFVVVLIKYKREVGFLFLAMLCLGSLIGAFFYSKGKHVKLSSFYEPEDVMKYMQKPMNKFFPYGIGTLMGIMIWNYNNTDVRNTFIGNFASKLKESSFLVWVMQLSGILMTLAVAVTINPIDHNRDGNTKVASSFWLLGSQIFVSIGLSLIFIPIWFDSSPRLSAFLSMSFMKPFSYLLYVMIPISGTLAIQWMYCLEDGIYVDHKMLHVYTIAFTVGMIILALILAIIVILPVSYPIKALYDKHRPNDPSDNNRVNPPENQSNNKKKVDEEALDEEKMKLKYEASDSDDEKEERKEQH